jgi:hypothetical protein
MDESARLPPVNTVSQLSFRADGEKSFLRIEMTSLGCSYIATQFRNGSAVPSSPHALLTNRLDVPFAADLSIGVGCTLTSPFPPSGGAHAVDDLGFRPIHADEERELVLRKGQPVRARSRVITPDARPSREGFQIGLVHGTHCGILLKSRF